MHKLLVLFYLVLSLAGCDHAGRTIVRHSTVNGVDVIYSQVTVLGAGANFECIQSRSGQCHYAVFKRDCSQQRSCPSAPLKQFAMAVNTKLHVINPPHGFQFCVSAEDKAMTRECLQDDAATKALAGPAPH
jgi:hypothetical protein